VAGIRENWSGFVAYWLSKEQMPADAPSLELRAQGAGISAAELATAVANAGLEKVQLGSPFGAAEGPWIYRVAS